MFKITKGGHITRRYRELIAAGLIYAKQDGLSIVITRSKRIRCQMIQAEDDPKRWNVRISYMERDSLGRPTEREWHYKIAA